MMGDRKHSANARGLRGNGDHRAVVTKVPAFTLGFWLIKILTTALGETAGDGLSMLLDLGYAMSCVLFLEVFAAAVSAQVAVRGFHPFLFWFVVVASTTAGTTVANICDRALGIGYAGGAALLAGLLAATFALWSGVARSLSIARIAAPATELFFWGTLLLCQALGTALGDWAADGLGWGSGGAALVSAACLAVAAAMYAFTGVSRTLLFWCAFVMTRPLGAALGDWLQNPVTDGGLGLDHFSVPALLLAAILLCVLHVPQRRAR
jgi:uncharacterized membrane-anchored protein